MAREKSGESVMGINSKIEWCEHTFNPFIGCTRISPACDHCYAAALSARTFKVKWGAGEARKRTSESYWKQPLKWNADYAAALDRHQHSSLAGNAGTEPKRPRVFCASLADVFDNEVNPQWRADLFDLIRITPNLDWMVLTKRIGNVRAQLTEAHQFVIRQIGGDTAEYRSHPLWDLGIWLQDWLAGKRASWNHDLQPNRS
jgi:protein gp37